MKTDNELIAEFMEFKKRHSGLWCGELDGDNVTTDDLNLFATSWDWLMPVVQKIESLDVKFKIQGVKVWVQSNFMQYHWYGGTVSEPKITCVYYGCLQFIKWYNEQKHNSLKS